MRSLKFATLSLFNSLVIERNGIEENRKVSKKLVKETIKNGFVFSQDVINCFSDEQLFELIEFISDNNLCLSFEDLNKSFHKSWKKVENADMTSLILEQALHYLTAQNDYNRVEGDYIFIPYEPLKTPKIKVEKIKLKVINGYTKEDILEKVISFINTGIAIKEDTLELIDNIFTELNLNFTVKSIEEIKNKELRIVLYKKFNIIPNDNIEFLRLLLLITTNKSLLIKNMGTYTKILEFGDYKLIRQLFESYIEANSLEKLSEIFLRFKDLFLTFKKIDISSKGKLRKIINLLRRKAVKNHKPLKEDFLNSLTKNIDTFSEDELIKELSKVNVFRKIRLLYALKFRMIKDANYIAYNIRNGKTFVEQHSNKKNSKRLKLAYEIIYKSLVLDIEPNVRGKNIFIPEFMNYALPSSEKQFLGNIPFGSYVEIDKNMVFGVYWENFTKINKTEDDYGNLYYGADDKRIDLDLSLIALEKYGWDASYRSDNRNILFSGDITDAINGANEYFYVKNNFDSGNSAILLNFFNGEAYRDMDCNYKFIVAKSKDKPSNKYIVDPNKVLLSLDDKINGTEKQKFIGLFESKDNFNRLYLFSSSIGNSITSRSSIAVDGLKEFTANKYKNTIMLKELLEDCGANVFQDFPIPDDEKNDILDLDLSPESLEKDTILKLLLNK